MFRIIIDNMINANSLFYYSMQGCNIEFEDHIFIIIVLIYCSIILQKVLRLNLRIICLVY